MAMGILVGLPGAIVNTFELNAYETGPGALSRTTVTLSSHLSPFFSARSTELMRRLPPSGCGMLVRVGDQVPPLKVTQAANGEPVVVLTWSSSPDLERWIYL